MGDGISEEDPEEVWCKEELSNGGLSLRLSSVVILSTNIVEG